MRNFMQSVESNGKKVKNYPKVIFYSGIPRSFRNEFIGYLYEISQVWPVILLSEKLDAETEEIVRNKELFPGLEKIIEVGQYGNEKVSPLNVLVRHRIFSKLAKNIILNNKPDIVFATGCNIFESYLRRFAKDANAITISGTGPFFLVRPDNVKTFSNLGNAYGRFPSFLPEKIKILLVKARKYSAHAFYYWISPLLSGQKPFFREPSCILWDVENVKGADYYFVYFKEDYDILVKKNAPAEKLFVLSHPLSGKGRGIFEKVYFPYARNKHKLDNKVLTVMWPEAEIEFTRQKISLIPEEEVRKKRIRIISLISKILKGWRVFIKPHPMVKDKPGQFQEIVKMLKPISDQIKVVNPSEPAEEYIDISDVIVGLPPASYTIFTASLQCPEKPILSLDLSEAFSGDIYKNFDEVEYINNEDKLINILELIRDNKYKKKIKREEKKEGFLSVVEALESILNKKNQ